jgi:hypothetical protein
VTQLFNQQPGPLPVGANITTHGGTLVLFAAGSGFTTYPGAEGMTITVDGNTVGGAKVFTNEAQSHKAFIANGIVVKGVAAGTHSIVLQGWSNVTDNNDSFNLTVFEVPAT